MNEIKVKRMLLAGLATFVAWILLEILLEQVLGQILFGNLIEELLRESAQLREWKALNILVFFFVALLNSTVLIWLYASLRPMYGVGTKTALITSALGIVFMWCLTIEAINLGLLPTRFLLINAVFVSVEIPIATLAGAEVYEGVDKEGSPS